MNVFPIAPGASRYLWFIIPLAALLVGVMLLVIVSLRGAQSARFEIAGDGLRLSGDLYGLLLSPADPEGFLTALRRQ